ncbi:hypothetical protein HAX54_040229 [Datura stramonium]|uniref:Uncharacterized protein n=1 Tax=Datura stramonium TaxID=4076 RepID=A0ABS8SK44_DATST|nr:hypothetical protein [Datura stramonium]
MTKEEEQLENVQNQQGEKHDEDKDEVPIKDNKRRKKNKKQQDKDPNAEEKIKKVLDISNNEVSIEWPPKKSSEYQETDKMADG